MRVLCITGHHWGRNGNLYYCESERLSRLGLYREKRELDQERNPGAPNTGPQLLQSA